MNRTPKTEHLARHQFKPGQSGNPTGRPKKKPLTELYEEILNDSKNAALVRRSILKAIEQAQSPMVQQLKEMADRVEGPLRQQIDHTGHITLETLIAAAANIEVDEPGDPEADS